MTQRKSSLFIIYVLLTLFTSLFYCLGYYVSKHCTELTSTTCTSCPSSSFTETPNGLTSCISCTVCETGNGNSFLLSIVFSVYFKNGYSLCIYNLVYMRNNTVCAFQRIIIYVLCVTCNQYGRALDMPMFKLATRSTMDWELSELKYM